MRGTTVPLVIAATVAFAACSNQQSAATAPPGSYQPADTQSTSPATSIKVTSTVYDADALGNPLLTRSDHANGAGFATYGNTDAVSSIVATDGSAWILFLGNQSVRTLYMVRGSQGMAIPDGFYWENVEAGSRCFDSNKNVVNMRVMAPGESNGNCMFITDFFYAGTKYKLAMGPNFSQTGRALVTCTAAAAGFCTSWTIVPNSGAAKAGVANLYRFANDGSLVQLGVYRDAFSVAVKQ